MRDMIARNFTLLLVCIGLAACSNLKPYKNDGTKNLTINIKTDGHIETAIHVHAVGPACELSYRGTFFAQNKQHTVSLPPGQPSYLVISFDTSSFWTGRSSMSHDTVIHVRKNYRYQLNLRYSDGIYNIETQEIDPNSGKGMPLIPTSLSGCKIP